MTLKAVTQDSTEPIAKQTYFLSTCSAINKVKKTNSSAGLFYFLNKLNSDLSSKLTVFQSPLFSLQKAYDSAHW